MRTTALLVTLLAIGSVAAFAVQNPFVIVFYEDGCPSCVEMEDLLLALAPDLTDREIARYEISEPESQELLTVLANAYDIEVTSVPIVFVGEIAITGMGRAQEFALRNALGDCKIEGCVSPISQLPSSRLRAELPRLFIILVLFAWLFLQQMN